MSDTIYSAPGATFYSILDNTPTGLVGTLGVRIIRNSDDVEVSARTTAGITESPAGSGRYKAALQAPEVKGTYTVLWDTGTVSPSTTATDDLTVTSAPPSFAEAEPGPLYAAPTGLRTFLGTNEDVLSDSEANVVLGKACDLIDERIGNRPIIEATGRKIPMGEEAEERVGEGFEEWRLKKLAEATIEIAARIFSDPGVESRQRARFETGDVSASGFYGPAFGERASALLNQSGLVVNTARMSGGNRRFRRHHRYCR